MYTHIHTYMSVYVSLSLSLSIYIYIERERDVECLSGRRPNCCVKAVVRIRQALGAKHQSQNGGEIRTSDGG